MQHNRCINASLTNLGEISDSVAVLVRNVNQPDNLNNVKFALKHCHTLKGLWLPYVRAPLSENWQATADGLAKKVHAHSNVLGILQITRIQLVLGSAYSTRICFVADLAHEIDEAQNGPAEIQWLTAEEIFRLCKEKPSPIAGPEILEFVKQANQNIFHLALTELRPDLKLIQNKLFTVTNKITVVKTQLEQLIDSAKFNEREQLLLFHVYLHFCLPSEVMSLEMFREFISSLGWHANISVPDLFRALDVSNQGYLTYRDLLLGLAAMEPCTQHGGPPAELRCRYIFRYYDKTCEGRMEFAGFYRLVQDIHRIKGLPTNDESLIESAAVNAKIFGIEPGECLPLNEFLSAIGQLKFRGTSMLFRAPVSTPATLQKWSCQNADHNLEKPLSHNSHSQATSASNIAATQLSPTRNSSNKFGPEAATMIEPGGMSPYELATHAVKVRRSGTLVDVLSLWEFNDAQATPNSTFKELKFQRLPSVDTFNTRSHANELLAGLRYFERPVLQEQINSKANSGIRIPKEAFSWGEVDMQALARCLLSLCRQVQEVMANEPRLVTLSSPTYILGDLHGNYHDLVCFEKTLWRMGPVLTPASFLFLGDYVDRGKFGLEIVAYLFSQKVLTPDKFFLLRGNHELRHVQKMFTFHRECIEKFGDFGEEIWEVINQCFDVMPLAAVIDDKIFCVHGGIPPPWNGEGKISSILDIPCPLSNPQEMAPLAWELIWNDPLSQDLFSMDSDNEELISGQGFVANMMRGTGHNFSESALLEFLKRNSLSHVVRAHEVKQNGFQVQMNGKLLTVFSSSRYCGGSNEAACVLAHRHKLRLIRLDTS